MNFLLDWSLSSISHLHLAPGHMMYIYIYSCPSSISNPHPSPISLTPLCTLWHANILIFCTPWHFNPCFRLKTLTPNGLNTDLHEYGRCFYKLP